METDAVEDAFGSGGYPHYQGTTETAGDNQAFSLMPPYVALLYCIKD